MSEYPYLCVFFGCPLQLLADGNYGLTKGSIEDAIEAHCRVCHPEIAAHED